MDTLDFLRAILPEGCWYFAATPSPSGKGFKHYACRTLGELDARIRHLDGEQAQEVYYACAGYREENVRSGDKVQYRTKGNVKLVKAFWLDLDVGPAELGKAAKYESQAAAVAALGAFLARTGLPRPTIVNSGYGVHVYWLLAAPVMPGQWAHTAGQLKSLTVGAGLLTDPTRTSDEASILRPVGTHNRKVKGGKAAAVPVTCGGLSDPVDHQAFHKLIEAAAASLNIELPAEEAAQKANPLGLIVPVGGYQASNADRVADRCEQVRLLKDHGGVSEPQWYHTLQVVAFCEEGEAKAHEWSAKHPDYKQDETQRKLDQLKSLGPTSCAKLEGTYAEACKGCKYKGRITSPIQLGVEVKEAAAPTLTIEHDDKTEVVELPNAPLPFRRGGGDQPGLYIDVEGVPVRFYPYDLFPVELCKDMEMGYEATRVRHHLPHEGWQEFSFRSALVASQREFTAALMDNSVKPENGKFMAAYMTAYLQELQSKTKIRKLYGAMGWTEDGGFLLGKKLYTKDGVQAAGVSNRVSTELVNGIAVKGTLEGWQAGIKLLDQPGLEAHLFSFLTGFGAPLFSTTEYDGAMFSMLGSTNSGKTLSATCMLSIYGKYKALRIGKKDTLNAKVEKMAMLGNLPVYLDEFTNVDADELSQFVYQVSEGRGRARLRSDSSMREAAVWQTLGVASTNASLTSKLAGSKDNAEAELMRLMEYRVANHPEFERQMTEVYEAVTHNYGHAGEAYIRWLVKADRAMLKAEIDKVVTAIRSAVSFEGKERFWVNALAVVLYGAVIAQALGLLGFKDFGATYTRLFHWACSQIRQSRGEVTESKPDEVTILSQFLDASMSGRLVVNEIDLGGKDVATTVVKPPVGALVVRYEQHKGVIYIDRKALKKYLTERQVDYTPLKRALIKAGVLVDADKKKVLGAGTTFSGGQVDTWQVDGRHVALSGAVQSLEA